MDINGDSPSKVGSWFYKVTDWLSSNPTRVVLTCVQVILWLAWIGWTVNILWQVASGTSLEILPDSPTQIRLDLLQALAFLVAWSLLLLTITIRVVNKGRDIEAVVDRTSWRLDQLHELDAGREIERKGLLEDTDARLSTAEKRIEEEVQVVRQENDQLRQENKRLRQVLSSES